MRPPRGWGFGRVYRASDYDDVQPSGWGFGRVYRASDYDDVQPSGWGFGRVYRASDCVEAVDETNTDGKYG